MDAAEIEVKQVGDFLLAVLREIACAGFLGKASSKESVARA
jgi:hypothetical protein